MKRNPSSQFQTMGRKKVRYLVISMNLVKRSKRLTKVAKTTTTITTTTRNTFHLHTGPLCAVLKGGGGLLLAVLV